MSRVYNFSAGPAVLPEEVLKEAAAEMLDYKGTGMSVMEMSHRSKAYQAIIDEAEADLRKLMGIPENYKVLFMQGGARYVPEKAKNAKRTSAERNGAIKASSDRRTSAKNTPKNSFSAQKKTSKSKFDRVFGEDAERIRREAAKMSAGGNKNGAKKSAGGRKNGPKTKK